MKIRGWVYIMTNLSMPGLVKIGYSTKDPLLRAEELNGTGVPHPFEVNYDAILVDPREVEQAVHKELVNFHEAKEFFRITVYDSISKIREVALSLDKDILHEEIRGGLEDKNSEQKSSAGFLRCRNCDLVFSAPTKICKRCKGKLE